MISGSLQEKSGYFYAVLSYMDESGKKKQKWIATHLPVKGNKKKAEEILLNLRISTVVPNSSSKVLFSDYMKSWMEIIRSKVAPSTFASYKGAVINDLVPYFEDLGISLTDIKPSDIQKYYDNLSNKGLSNNTILHYHAYIRKALQAAFLRDLIPNNPADKVERPRKEFFVAKTYSENELNQLLAVAKGTKIEIPIVLTVFYGLRRSEVLGLRWENIDFENKTLLISHSASEANIDGSYKLYTTDKLKKKSSYRTLPLLEDVEHMLIQEKEKQLDNGVTASLYVCIDEKGELIKPCYLSKAFGKLLSKNNLRHIRYHDLRHSCANMLISSRVPLIEVQQWLGHSNISTTADLYSHLGYETKICCGQTIEKKSFWEEKTMNIYDYENCFDKEVMRQANDLLMKGDVLCISEDEPQVFSSEIKAPSDKETSIMVSIETDLNDDIIDFYCSCDHGKPCVHMAATLIGMELMDSMEGKDIQLIIEELLTQK